uniref:Uncharacterized protein n=1 Tax=Anguilla anguilla TaxID=7936 RepID=A0A0E9VBN2_ANGAN
MAALKLPLRDPAAVPCTAKN